jgi:hypothetical protein
VEALVDEAVPGAEKQFVDEHGLTDDRLVPSPRAEFDAIKAKALA